MEDTAHKVRRAAPPARESALSRALTWTAIIAGCVAGANAYTPWGLTIGSSVPMVALGIAGVALGGRFILLTLRSQEARAACAWRAGAALAVVVLVMAISTLLSPERSSAFFGMENSSEGFLQLATFFLLVVAGAFAATSLRERLQVVAPLVIVAEAALIGAQMYRGLQPTGSAPNSTATAQLLLLALPFAVAPAFDKQGRALPLAKAWKPWSLVGIAVVLMVVSEATNALVAAGLWLVWLAFMSYRRVPVGKGIRSWPTWMWAIVGSAAAAALAVAARLAAPDTWLGFFYYRRLYWVAGLRLLEKFPVFGAGPDTMRSLVAPIAPAAMLETGATGIHNGFMQLSVDPHNIIVFLAMYFGVAGLAAFGWLTFEAGRNWVRLSRAGSGPNWAAMAVVMYLISLLSAPGPIQTLVLFGVVLGASLRPERMERPAALASASRWATLAVGWVGLVAALLTLLLGATYLAVGSRTSAVSTQDAAAAKTAAAIWRWDPYLHYAASLRIATAAGGTVPDRSDVAEIASALALAPRDPVYALEYARTLASYGVDATTTRAAYERAISLFPNSAEANLAYARFLSHLGALREAERYALVGIRIAPSEPEAHTLAADVYALLGDKKNESTQRAEAARLQALLDANLRSLQQQRSFFLAPGF